MKLNCFKVRKACDCDELHKCICQAKICQNPGLESVSNFNLSVWICKVIDSLALIFLEGVKEGNICLPRATVAKVFKEVCSQLLNLLQSIFQTLSEPPIIYYDHLFSLRQRDSNLTMTHVYFL